MSGAVIRLPFDTTGIGAQDQQMVRAVDVGIGSRSWWPNIQSEASIWAAGRRRSGVPVAGAEPAKQRTARTGSSRNCARWDCPRTRPRRCDRGRAAWRRCDRRRARRPRPSRWLPAIGAHAAQRRLEPVGVLVHVLEPVDLGTDVPARERIVAVAAHRHDAVPVDLDRYAAEGSHRWHARKCVVAIARGSIAAATRARARVARALAAATARGVQCRAMYADSRSRATYTTRSSCVPLAVRRKLDLAALKTRSRAGSR